MLRLALRLCRRPFSSAVSPWTSSPVSALIAVTQCQPPWASCCTVACVCVLSLCDPMGCSPPGSSARGFSRQGHWSGLPFPAPGIFPTRGLNPCPCLSCIPRQTLHHGCHLGSNCCTILFKYSKLKNNFFFCVCLLVLMYYLHEK